MIQVVFARLIGVKYFEHSLVQVDAMEKVVLLHCSLMLSLKSFQVLDKVYKGDFFNSSTLVLDQAYN